MMSIEIKVNGNPVAVITAYNDGAFADGEGGEAANYPYQGFVLAVERTSIGGPTSFRGVVIRHKYDDGILELSRRMLECICDEGST